MTILLTGGAGYIGSHTARLLRDRGRDVVVLDDLSHGRRAAVDSLVRFVEGDIADTVLVRDLVADHGVDAVLHLAALKSPEESVRRPGAYFDVNVARSCALIDTLVSCGVERFVFSSTCAVYGNPEVVPVTEDAAIRPESPYGESKHAVERLLSWYDRCHLMHSVSLRYFNAAGAWPDGSLGEDWATTTNLIPLAAKATLGERPSLQVFGHDYPTRDGTAVRDYVHVVDLAEAHLSAVEYLERGGESTTCNLGRGAGSSILEVLAALERCSGRTVPYEFAPRRPGDPAALHASSERARRLFAWSPSRDLDEIVASAWSWHSRRGGA